jgi:hypothetical protein
MVPAPSDVAGSTTGSNGSGGSEGSGRTPWLALPASGVYVVYGGGAVSPWEVTS